jgi:hypothetical protein
MTYGKTNKKNKAPKVTIPKKNKPFSETKTTDDKSSRTSPMQLLKKKRLSK